MPLQEIYHFGNMRCFSPLFSHASASGFLVDIPITVSDMPDEMRKRRFVRESPYFHPIRFLPETEIIRHFTLDSYGAAP